MSTVKKQKTPAEALAALMRLCSRAEKSSGDARRLMHGWGIGAADSERIMEQLTAQKFVDDERFATAYTREKLRLSGWGEHKIKAALVTKGVVRATIDSVLKELIKPEKQTDRLEKYLARRVSHANTSDATTSHELHSKLMRYGLSLGYDYETVATAVAAAIKKTFRK